MKVLVLVVRPPANSLDKLRPFSPFILEVWSGPGLTFFILLIFCTTVVSSTLSPELQRLNYGVLFEAQSQIQMSKETWIHTFEVQLPEQLNMIRLSGCNQDIKTCSVVNDVLLEVNQIRQETELFFNYTIGTIENLVPERNNILKFRTKRSILPFIGDLSKSLFGTATVEDVQLLAKHINVLNRLTDNVVKSVQQHEDHLSSYIQTVDDRFTNIVKGIKENELAIRHIHTQLYETFDNVERSFTTMSVLMSKQIEKSGKLESVFQKLLEGIFDLVKGKLSPHLIPPKLFCNVFEIFKTYSMINSVVFISFILIQRISIRMFRVYMLIRVQNYSFP